MVPDTGAICHASLWQGQTQGIHLVMRMSWETDVTSRVLPMSCTRHKSDPHHLRGMSNWGQVDHPRLEEWLLECGNPIPYISNDNFSPEDTFIVMTSYQDTLMSTKRTLKSLECVDSSMVTLHVEVGWSDSFLQMENSMMISRKGPWTRRWKTHEDRNQYQITDLWWQRSLHRWWRCIQETQVVYGGQEVGRRKGTERRWLSYGLTQWV
jgi:hypothetical protein